LIKKRGFPFFEHCSSNDKPYRFCKTIPYGDKLYGKNHTELPKLNKLVRKNTPVFQESSNSTAALSTAVDTTLPTIKFSLMVDHTYSVATLREATECSSSHSGRITQPKTI
jgi:hypothetical protein